MVQFNTAFCYLSFFLGHSVCSTSQDTQLVFRWTSSLVSSCLTLFAFSQQLLYKECTCCDTNLNTRQKQFDIQHLSSHSICLYLFLSLWVHFLCAPLVEGMYLIDNLNTRQIHLDIQDISVKILLVFLCICICSCLFEFAFSAQLLWKECTCQVQREKRKTGKILEEFWICWSFGLEGGRANKLKFVYTWIGVLMS